MDRRVRRDRQTLLRRQTDDLLVPPTHPQVLRISSGKVSLNVPTSHRPRWEATACVRTGSGRVLELSTSPGATVNPSFHVWSISGRKRPMGAQFAGVCQRSCGVAFHQRHFDPRAAAPQLTGTQRLAFQIIWLQGSTQTSNRTKQKGDPANAAPSRRGSRSNRPRAGGALSRWEIQKASLIRCLFNLKSHISDWLSLQP